MTDLSPITPPPELVQKIRSYALYGSDGQLDFELRMIRAAYAAGADQELEACCEQMQSIPSPLGVPFGKMASNALRAARRPKPPTLKEQALAALNRQSTRSVPSLVATQDCDTIRRALEALPND
jgi:hypothetical protein